MEKSAIIQKIKDLLKLSTSSNEAEAETAKNLAKKLQDKHGIADAELVDEETPFKKENLLFSCEEVIPWKMALASALSDHFYCTLLQLKSQDQFNKSSYEYYLYGSEEDIKICQTWFKDFEFKLKNLILEHTYKRGERYIFSFSQGLSDGLNQLLQEVKIDLEIKNKSLKQNEPNQIVHISEKEIKKPESISVTTNSRQEGGLKILDPYAYYYGVSIGQKLSLPNILSESNAN